MQPSFNRVRHGSYVIEGKGGGVSTIAVSVRKVRPFQLLKDITAYNQQKRTFDFLDVRNRLRFALKMRGQHTEYIWTKDIAFYLDVASLRRSYKILTDAVFYIK